jgi:hypothetical protein
MTSQLENTQIAFQQLLQKIGRWPAPLVVALCVLLFRVALNLPAFIGANALPLQVGFRSGVSPTQHHFNYHAFPSIWSRWDSGYYLKVATEGYNGGEEMSFMPLYPFAVRWLALGQAWLMPWVGVLMSHAAFVAACALLWRRLSQDHNRRIATLTVVLLNVFPTAFFFSALYTESVFLLLSVLVYDLSRRQRFGWAAVGVLLAALTRVNGILLVAIPIIELWRDARGDAHKSGWLVPFAWRVVCLGATAALGLIVFGLYLHFAHGSVGVYFHWQQTLMKRHIDFPLLSILDSAGVALWGLGGFGGNWFMRVLSGFELVMVLLFVAAAVLGWRRWALPRSLWAYLCLGLLLVLSSHGPGPLGVYAASRYVLPLFPGFVVLAMVLAQVGRGWRWLVLCSSAGLLCALTAWFANGRWVA